MLFAVAELLVGEYDEPVTIHLTRELYRKPTNGCDLQFCIVGKYVSVVWIEVDERRIIKRYSQKNSMKCNIVCEN